MKMRRLGSQGLEVSELGLGCMGMSAAYGTAPAEADAVAVLRRAAEIGFDFFDTAEVYGPFSNEILVGGALKGVDGDVKIATKFGFDIPPEGGYPRGVSSRPEHIRSVCDASLQRLGIDAIDVFYQHRVDPQVPIEDVAGTVGELVAAGKVRYFGLSEAGPDTIRRAHATFPVSVLQSEYSLWTRGVEDRILPTCRELGIGFVAYSPLGRGFLAGAAAQLPENDFRRYMPRWKGEALESNLSLFETLARLAARHECSPAQLAIAWLLRQGDDIVPIPGTVKLHRLEENRAASELSLSDADLDDIARAVPESEVKGGRYDEAQLAMLEL